MKKLFALMSLIFCMSLTTCGTTYQEALDKEVEHDDFGNGYFTIVTQWDDSNYTYRIVYANDTKVKYLVVSSGHRLSISPLYDSDGTVQLYAEIED